MPMDEENSLISVPIENHIKKYSDSSDVQDVEMKDVNNDKKQVSSDDDDDDWSKMSAESVISRDFSFDSSDEEDSLAAAKAKTVSAHLTKRFDINLLVASIERGEAVLGQVVGKD
eukprot:1137168-Ditylum_brightwellii.AAC.1